MAVTSAGVLLYRKTSDGPEMLLVHPGGPFWARKDDGAWSIPKGLVAPEEASEDAARREFCEETGTALGAPLLPLGTFRQPGGKMIVAFAALGDLDAAGIRSNLFTMEWPPHSGRTAEFPEVDRAAWFDPDTAAAKMLKGQRPILAALLARLEAPSGA
ncbi:MAG: NUDIX domain-containing protein [Bauldia sp.]|nr:NUDIX domain-containing protein [Bauldia sp.]